MDKKIKYEIGDRVRYVTDGRIYKGIVVDKLEDEGGWDRLLLELEGFDGHNDRGNYIIDNHWWVFNDARSLSKEKTFNGLEI